MCMFVLVIFNFAIFSIQVHRPWSVWSEFVNFRGDRRRIHPGTFRPVFMLSFRQKQTIKQKRNISLYAEDLWTNQWPVWPFLNGGQCSSTNTGLATPTAERSGRLDLLPSQPPPTPPGISPQPQGMSLILFSVNLLTVCPLASIGTRINNPGFEDHSNSALFMMHGGSEGHSRLESFSVRLQEFQNYAGQKTSSGRTKYTNHHFEILTLLRQNSKLWLLTVRS